MLRRNPTSGAGLIPERADGRPSRGRASGSQAAGADSLFESRLEPVGDDLDVASSAAVGGLPLAALEPAFDVDESAPAEVRAPGVLALRGVGVDVAGALLVAAGDNPERMRSEASFAHLCGASALPASSGKTTGRHRLNRGGNQDANRALWCVVMSRMAWDQKTKEDVTRRTQDGGSKKEIIRCLKRYVAREVYHYLLDPAAPNTTSDVNAGGSAVVAIPAATAAIEGAVSGFAGAVWADQLSAHPGAA